MNKLLLSLALNFILVFAQANEFKSEYFIIEKTGAGQPMVLIPGLSSSGEVWDQTVAHFSKSYECHVITLSGFAGVPAANNTESFLPHVRDELIRYLNHIGRPVILIGHSLGGSLTYEIGSMHPELIATAIVVDGVPYTAAYMFGGIPKENIDVQIEQMYQGMKSQTREQFEAYQPMIFSSMITDPEQAKQCSEWGINSDPHIVSLAFYELLKKDLRKSIKDMNTPTLQMIAWASYKPYGATEESVRKQITEQTQHHPNIEIVLNENVRHFIMLDDPEWFIVEIEHFLNKNL